MASFEDDNTRLSIDLNYSLQGEVNSPESAKDPIVGMCFNSGTELDKFCVDYAHEKGFAYFITNGILLEEFKAKGVKRGGVGEHEAKTHMYQWMTLKCQKGGRKQTVGSKVTGCPAYVYAKVDKHGMMKIQQVNLNHNHDLVPKCNRFMPNCICINDCTMEELRVNDKVGIAINQNINAQLVKNGGYENLPFYYRDARNAINLERRQSRFEGDAFAMENYFNKEKELNPNFYSAIEKEADSRLLNSFWSNARSRNIYDDFGDIIMFDTTFSTNRMSFTPFVGVNHHGKSIVFLAALISSEDTETFVWVFKHFLTCMGGKCPKAILTDQDKAIGATVEIVFLSVPHRLCLWHILQNANVNLGSHPKWVEIEVVFKVVVHDFLDTVEFEEASSLLIANLGWREMNGFTTSTKRRNVGTCILA